MRGTSRRGRVAVGALAVTGGTLLATVGTAGTAGAATGDTPAYYTGQANGQVLRLTLNLPSQLAAPLKLPSPLQLDLIGAKGSATHDALKTGGDLLSSATATLAGGSLLGDTPLSALGLDKSVHADRDHPQPAAAGTQTIALPSGLGQLDLETLLASVVPSTDANSAHARLAKASVATLGQLLPVDQLKSVVDQLSAAGVPTKVTDIVDQVNGLLDQVLKQDPTGQVAQVAQGVQDALQQVAQKVDGIVANVGDTSVLTVDLVDAAQSIGPVDGAAKSVASAGIGGINVLNGLLTVNTFTSQATAIANGTPGGAQASFSGKEPIATLGTPLIKVTLDDSGLKLSDIPGLPADISGQVDGLLAQLQTQLNNLLNTLGVATHYEPGKVVNVASDGTAAQAIGPSYHVALFNTLQPTAAPILDLGIGDGTMAQASAKQATEVLARPPALPHTGANLPLTAGGGFAAVVAAVFLRRRLSH